MPWRSVSQNIRLPFELARVAPDEELIKVILEQYEHPFEFQLANHYRGMEILRRLIGIAQLPLQLSLEQKSKLLEKAKELILNL